MGFIIRPIHQHDFDAKAHVVASGETPIAISRSTTGEVAIHSRAHDATLYYAVGKGKAVVYKQPFNLREGGLVTAWSKENEKFKVSFEFPKIESIPMQVVFASSEETGEADASNLLDGDPTTIWHSMYSVTVAQYPHWVDFDANAIKMIKGFTYTPRQGGGNGNIKGYKLQVSTDGKNWSDPAAEGNFENNGKPKTINLAKPVKGRFIRFTAMSSQNGQDFASGAEFSVSAE
ncbi:discoidin domain-containing protein [Sphingobacterium sp. SG20118]|uniref:discoidin domain-containing protein n=1 Tax=Sphingobacterium sp. SG20118 TaxID=3367156 RepID=UPI0037DFC0DE